MKTITVELDDDVYAAAERLASRRHSSVNELLRQTLEQAVGSRAALLGDAEKEAAQRRELAELFRKADLVLGYRPSREKTYER